MTSRGMLSLRDALLDPVLVGADPHEHIRGSAGAGYAPRHDADLSAVLLPHQGTAGVTLGNTEVQYML